MGSTIRLFGASVTVSGAEAMLDAKSKVPRGFGYVDVHLTPSSGLEPDAIKAALFKALKPLQNVTFRGAKVRVEGARPSAMERIRIEKASVATAAAAAAVPRSVAVKPVRLRRRKGEPTLLLPLDAVVVDAAAARDAEAALQALSGKRMPAAQRAAAEKAARNVLHRPGRPVRITWGDAAEVGGAARWDTLEGNNGTHLSRRMTLQAAAESPVHMPMSTVSDSESEEEEAEVVTNSTAVAAIAAPPTAVDDVDVAEVSADDEEDAGADEAEEETDGEMPGDAGDADEGDEPTVDMLEPADDAPAPEAGMAAANILDDEDNVTEDDDMFLANVVDSSLPRAPPMLTSAAAIRAAAPPPPRQAAEVDMEVDLAEEAEGTLRVLADMFKDPSLTQMHNLKRRRDSASSAPAVVPAAVATAAVTTAAPRPNAWRTLLYGEQATVAGATQSTVLPPDGEVDAPGVAGGKKRPRYMLQEYKGAIVPHRDTGFKFAAVFDQRVEAAATTAADASADEPSKPRPPTFAFSFDVAPGDAPQQATPRVQSVPNSAPVQQNAQRGRGGGAGPSGRGRGAFAQPREMSRPAAPDMKSIAMSFMRPTAGSHDADLLPGMHVAEDGALHMSQLARKRLTADYKKNVSRARAAEAGRGRGGRGRSRGRGRR